MKRLFALAALCIPVLGIPLLAACDASLRPPGDAGVCYQYIQFKDGRHRFNVMSRNTPSLEKCAATLEAMRMRFLMLGGNQVDIDGAYQTKFLFITQTGVSTSDTLDGAAFPALVRTGDGGLAPPGAFRHPAR